MMLKALGQFVVASLFLNFFPADVEMLEWQATGKEGGPEAHLTLSEYRDLFIGYAGLGTAPVDYPVKVDLDSYGVVTSAVSALVADAESGMMLLAKHPTERRSIGSVTKLVSALVFLDQNPDLAAQVTLDPATDLVEGGRIYLAFYDALTLEEVLAASLVGSDNTATESLVRFSGLSKEAFVQAMNEKAAALGMQDSRFVEPTGINPDNISTAQDLVLLLEAAENSDLISQYMTAESITVQHASGRTVAIENTNTALESFLNEGEFQITAGKTGFLPQAGYVLATTVDHLGDKIHVVVLGSDTKDTRVTEVKGLAAWAFKTFEWPE